MDPKPVQPIVNSSAKNVSVGAFNNTTAPRLTISLKKGLDSEWTTINRTNSQKPHLN